MENQSTATMGGRIRLARTKRGISQAELGRVFNISREAVASWEADRNVPSADKINRIAAELQISTAWLLSGDGPMDGTQPPPINAPFGPSADMTSDRIPVMGTAEGGPDGLVEWNGEVVDRVPRPPALAGAKGGYALYVKGKSMEPRYHEGELIYVHPGRPILPQNYVVVQFYKDEGGGTPYAWVKQFISRNEKTCVFQQYNPPETLKIPTQRILTVHRVVGAGEL